MSLLIVLSFSFLSFETVIFAVVVVVVGISSIGGITTFEVGSVGSIGGIGSIGSMVIAGVDDDVLLFVCMLMAYIANKKTKNEYIRIQNEYISNII
jgi:hypothetical protein